MLSVWNHEIRGRVEWCNSKPCFQNIRLVISSLYCGASIYCWHGDILRCFELVTTQIICSNVRIIADAHVLAHLRE